MKNQLHYRWQLSDAEALILNTPVNGDGGFQSFARKLQHQLDGPGVVGLTYEDFGRAVRHANYSKSGGFEGRLAKALGRHINAEIARMNGGAA